MGVRKYIDRKKHTKIQKNLEIPEANAPNYSKFSYIIRSQNVAVLVARERFEPHQAADFAYDRYVFPKTLEAD